MRHNGYSPQVDNNALRFMIIIPAFNTIIQCVYVNPRWTFRVAMFLMQMNSDWLIVTSPELEKHFLSKPTRIFKYKDTVTQKTSHVSYKSTHTFSVILGLYIPYARYPISQGG